MEKLNHPLLKQVIVLPFCTLTCNAGGKKKRKKRKRQSVKKASIKGKRGNFV